MNVDCGSCRFSDPVLFGEGEMVLQCRRYPPTMTISEHEGETGLGTCGWPVVDAVDWCGEHQPSP